MSKFFTNSEIDYSSENAANMLISHGRYFVDNFLIPLIRAITDLGTIFVLVPSGSELDSRPRCTSLSLQSIVDQQDQPTHTKGIIPKYVFS